MTNSVLKTKEYRSARFRSMIYQSFGMNYETMQAPAWAWSMMPVLNKLYGDNPELLREKYREHLKFYNNNPLINPLVAGLVLSLEETKADNISETALTMRTALMGPTAGLGDSLFWITGRTVFGSIAGYMAIEGSPMGLVICALLWVAIYALRVFFFNVGYEQGAVFVTQRTSQLRNLTNAAVIVGLAVVGAMIPSMVNISTKVSFAMGDATATLDGFFNSILPKFYSVAFTAAVYFGLKSKFFTTTKMIWTVILVCIVLSFFGIV